MYIKNFHIQNFKSFEDVKFTFNSTINVLTGENNSGKTTVLEAIALWQECFRKLLTQAKISRSGKKATAYQKGDYILGNTQSSYFPFEEINSVRSPNFEDVFYQLDKQKIISLSATLCDVEEQELTVSFQIRSSGSNYAITLQDFGRYDFKQFNVFFKHFPNPITISYASPVSAILQRERFTTVPNIREEIVARNAVNVFRNRLYLVHTNSQNVHLYQSFLSDLNYILFNNAKQIELFKETDVQKDTQVVFKYVLGKDTTKKDIALLGSGTLQIIEILLNLYYKDNKTDLDLVLLDEPDSHIHRDIQARLIQVMRNQATANQVFITTHNEAFIRSANLRDLFHLEGKPKNDYQSVYNNQIQEGLSKTKKSFQGIYPSPINSIMRSIGQATGLDFINALEANRIIFVEGEDDAKYIHILLQKNPQDNKKYVFWVMNGISNIFKETTGILAYKMLFEQIRNEKTLWEKSFLAIDRDFMSDEHREALSNKIKTKLALQNHITEGYTFEAILLKDLAKTAIILSKWFQKKGYIPQTNVYASLQQSYQNLLQRLQTQYLKDEWKNDATQKYRDLREKTKIWFDDKKGIIDLNDVQLAFYYQKHLENSINNSEFHKIANKDDVFSVIQETINACGIMHLIDTDQDVIEWLECVDVSSWFDDWKFIKELAVS